MEDEPSSWFLHFTTDEKSPSSPVVTVNGFQLPHELELPVIATDSTTEYIYDLRYLAIGNTDWATAPVIEAVRVSGLPAGVKLYSATIDNRKNSTTVSTEILDTDILHQTSTGVPYDASVSLNNLSQAENRIHILPMSPIIMLPEIRQEHTVCIIVQVLIGHLLQFRGTTVSY